MSRTSTATRDLPGPMDKREILYSPETPAQELVSWGEAYEESGFPLDALDFFGQAQSAAHLERFLSQAVEDGDLFVYQRCLEALDRHPDARQREALVARAEALGKEAFARRARGDDREDSEDPQDA